MISENKRGRRRFPILALLFLMMFLSMPVQASAAWKKNSNGTYSYYENGKKVKNKWIKTAKGTYYINSKGVRQTGWLYKGKKWYYFSTSGIMLKNRWIKYRNNLYYAGTDGALYVNGMHKVRGKYTYAFNRRGAVVKGRRTYKNKTYYFSAPNGRMVTNKWVKTGGKYYYYGSDGAMVKNRWVGRYYVGKDGLRMTATWKDSRYLGADGKACVGLTRIGNYYYYFNAKTYKKAVNTSITVNGKTYTFDSVGRGKLTTANSVPTPSCVVESTYYTDPVVDDEAFLAAIIYCEAGNQLYTGKVAVGLVLMNRMYSPLFPDKLRELVYQKQQFEPARNGTLTKALQYPSYVNAESRQAAREVIAQFKNYKSGQKVYLKINGKTEEFPYLFFMTLPAYKRLGLTSKYKKIGDHVFFSEWKK